MYLQVGNPGTEMPKRIPCFRISTLQYIKSEGSDKMAWNQITMTKSNVKIPLIKETVKGKTMVAIIFCFSVEFGHYFVTLHCNVQNHISINIFIRKLLVLRIDKNNNKL
jgi:hypothetical protein